MINTGSDSVHHSAMVGSRTLKLCHEPNPLTLHISPSYLIHNKHSVTMARCRKEDKMTAEITHRAVSPSGTVRMCSFCISSIVPIVSVLSLARAKLHHRKHSQINHHILGHGCCFYIQDNAATWCTMLRYNNKQ